MGGCGMVAVGVVHGWLVVDVCGWVDVCVGLCGFVAGPIFCDANLCEHDACAVIAIRQSRLPPTLDTLTTHSHIHAALTPCCAHGAVTVWMW